MDFIIVGLLVIVIILLLLLLLRRTQETKIAELSHTLDKLRQEVVDEARASRRESLESSRGSMATLGQLLTESQKNAVTMQDTRLAELNQQLQEKQKMLQQTIHERLSDMDNRLRISAQ